ncbi:MAG: hypothetical protein KZQ76_07230 [Candidatus Thiodiazotropha sp. (ex Epidulcina cf. delphinae)]|nr:hypothetical protein [Candidatus Thiodiazotropha sp. (ex Epidulcina cf. delphinae)]
MHSKPFLRLLAVLVIGVSSYSTGAGAGAGAFEDDEACLMCHKYIRMARITEEGVFRSYYVPAGTFAKTVHRNVPCRDCHDYIKQLPHRKVEEGVRCDQECHSKKNPATGKPFSHKAIYDLYADSVHARDKNATGLDNDKPYCVTCHTNPVYNPNEAEPPKEILDRCELCHEKRDFVRQWYFHTSRRVLDIKRTGQEIVAICIRCHADQELIERHENAADEEGRPLGKKFPIAATSYQKSFHGKVTRYGLDGAATCLDCHADNAKYYEGVHKILPSRNPESPVSQQNRVETCRRCHEAADEKYAIVDPHPSFDEEFNPVLHKAEEIYGVVGEVVVTALLGLSLFETIGRRRDGVGWRLRRGSTWWRRSRRKRDRIIPR